LGARDRSAAGHRESRRPQRSGGIRDGAAGGHQIVNDHQQPSSSADSRDSLRVSGELAGRGNLPLRRAQARGVRPDCGEPEQRRDLDDHPGAAEDPGGARGQPLHVLPAAFPGDHRGRGHRHQPDRPVGQLLYGQGQGASQDAGQVPPAPLLIGEQGGASRSGVVGGNGQWRQSFRCRIWPVPPRPAQRRLAPDAQRPAGVDASGATAREDQLGQKRDHAMTVAVVRRPRKAGSAICG
jgi:hypothetical protein